MKLSNILHLHKHIPEALQERKIISLIGRDPYVDWALSLLITSILSLVLIFLGIAMYFAVINKTKEPVLVETPIEEASIDMKNLEKVLSEFDKREEVRNGLLRDYNGFRDPSI